MNSLRGLFPRSSEYRGAILGGEVVHFANGIGVALSPKVILISLLPPHFGRVRISTLAIACRKTCGETAAKVACCQALVKAVLTLRNGSCSPLGKPNSDAHTRPPFVKTSILHITVMRDSDS